MIIRGPRPDRHWTCLANATLRDRRLSFRARGVLAFLLSQPEGYRITCNDLAEEAAEGRDATAAALHELVEAGYLVRKRVQAEGGRFSWETTCYDTPQPFPENPEMVPPAETPKTAGQTIPWKTVDGKPGIKDFEVPEAEGLKDQPLSQAASLRLLPAPVDPVEDSDYWKANPKALGALREFAPVELLDPALAEWCDRITAGTAVYWDDQMRLYVAWQETKPASRRHKNLPRGFKAWVQEAIRRDQWKEARRAETGR